MFDFEKDFMLPTEPVKKPEPVKPEPMVFDFEPKKESKPEPKPVIENLKKKKAEKSAPPKMDAKLVQWFDDHFYKVQTDGEELFYPSATTILQAYPNEMKGISQWRETVGSDVADMIFHQAARKGRLIHQTFEEMLKGTPVFYQYAPENEAGIVITEQWDYLQILRLSQFMEVVKPEVLMSEQVVFNHQHQYAGTLDLLLKIEGGSYLINGKTPVKLEGGLYVADIKTSNSIQDKYHLQTSAYAYALMEQHPKMQITGTMILHTKAMTKGGIEGFGCKVRTADEMEIDFSQFLTVYEAWKINPSPSKPKVFSMPGVIRLSQNYFSNQYSEVQ